MDGAAAPHADHRSAAFLRAREQRRDLLVRLHNEGERELAAKLEACGEEFVLKCCSCGHSHRCERSCCLKWCPVCARKRSAQRVAKYAKAAALMKWPLHVTLTITNVGDISVDHIRGLKRAFQRLRRTKLWKTCVAGGVVAIELTNKGRGWHPHLHTLCDAEWLSLTVAKPNHNDSRERKAAKCKAASTELHDTWCLQVGQMMASIDVRRCSGEEAVREVLKYAVKPGDLVDSPDPIGPAIRAISGGRLTTPYGSLYGLRRELTDDERPAFACPSCASTGSMMPEEVVERMMSSTPKDRERRAKAARREHSKWVRELDRKHREAVNAARSAR